MMQSEVPAVPDGVVFNYLDGAANHELKNLVAIYYLSQPDEAFAARGVARDLRARQDPELSWDIKSSSVTDYCERSLEPVGAVLGTEIRTNSGKKLTAWQADPEHLEGRLALAGFFGDWGLRWPELSVQQAYGNTTSPTEVRSPRVRHILYQAILNSDTAYSIAELTKVLGGAGYKSSPEVAIANQVNALTTLGILSKTSNRRDYDPLVQVVRDEFEHSSFALGETTAENQALYGAIGRLGVGKTVTINQLVEAAQEMDDSIDDAKLRSYIRQGVTQRNGYPSLSLVNPEAPSVFNEQSQISLTEDAKQPIAELVSGVESIKSGTGEAANMYAGRAKQILDTPHDVSVLIAKSREFSPYVNSQERDETNQQLETIVRDLGSVTTDVAREELLTRFGRKLSKPFVREVLNDLVYTGNLFFGTATVEPHQNVLVNSYTLPK